MKYIIFLFLISITSIASGDESPYDKFSAAGNITNVSNISWEYVTNVQQSCDQQRVREGGKPYAYKVQACSTWGTNLLGQHFCHIITGKTVDMWTLGHEIRHCFKGSFHK
jgi:hypothetical protein